MSLPEAFCVESMPYITSTVFAVTPPYDEPPGFKVIQSVTIIIHNTMQVDLLLLDVYVIVQNFLFTLPL